MEPREAVGGHQGKGGCLGWKVRQTSRGDEEMVVFICLKKGICRRLEIVPRIRPLSLGGCGVAS